MVRYLQRKRNTTARRRKISFKDPFTSAAPFQPAQKVFVAPMVREGVTSIENCFLLEGIVCTFDVTYF